MLEVITGCFSATSGVPELGLGNAEVNVVFNAWNLHLTLCQNAKSFRTKSLIAQVTIWALALLTTLVAISVSSLGNGGDPSGAVLQRVLLLDASTTATITRPMEYGVVLLPIIAAVVTTMASKKMWRDKWSVCLMAATYIVFEIYKFRMATLEYDPAKLSPATIEEGDDDKLQTTAKQKAQMARQLFVLRIQEFYGACVTDMSQGGALKRTRAKVSAEERQEYRANQENPPSLAEWSKVKVHVEKHFYNAPWVMPRSSFVGWMSGLHPYLRQRTLKEELRKVIDALVISKAILSKRKPLRERSQIRPALKRSRLTKRRLNRRPRNFGSYRKRSSQSS